MQWIIVLPLRSKIQWEKSLKLTPQIQHNYVFHCSSFSFYFLNSCRLSEVRKVRMCSLCSSPWSQGWHHVWWFTIKTRKLASTLALCHCFLDFGRYKPYKLEAWNSGKGASPSAKINSYQLWVLHTTLCRLFLVSELSSLGSDDVFWQVYWLYSWSLLFFVSASYRWHSR